MNTIRLIVSILLVIIVLDLLCVKINFKTLKNVSGETTQIKYELKMLQDGSSLPSPLREATSSHIEMTPIMCAVMCNNMNAKKLW